jgi:peptidylprolyl isomerase
LIKKTWLIVLLGILFLIAALVYGLAPGKVRNGDTVTIHYTLTLDDGTVYDSTLGREPLTTTLGQGSFIVSFEDQLIGMRPGETKTFTLTPEEAFGKYRTDLIGTVERSWLPEGVEPVIGKQLTTRLEDGSENVVSIKSFTDTTLTLDANHPLAGKSLTFQIKLLALDPKPVANSLMKPEILSWAILALAGSVFVAMIFHSKKRTRLLFARKSLRPRTVR